MARAVAIHSLLFALLSWAILFAVSDAATVYQKYTNMCNGVPTITRKHDKTLQWLFQNVGEVNIVSNCSPQHEAACWMLSSGKKFTPQRFVLAVVYYATKGAKWDVNTDWLTRKNECSWYGVECNTFGKVINLDLGYIKVDGLVPREIGLLSELQDLDLHGNDLQGVIPHKLMTGLKKLEYLRLQMNGMFGAIHKEIVYMKNLKQLFLYGNYIAGTIPKDLAKLKKLGKCASSKSEA